MILFSNCKINIGLYITEKRQDGYHNLKTIFFPLPIYDVLELIEAPELGITIIGQEIPGLQENNIVIKAWRLLQKDFPDLPKVHFHLLKNIPAGAGLGAGSANGAYALIGLNQKFGLGLTKAQLLNYALKLGSDCPFFILNQPALATGRGEIFSEVAVNLSAYKILIVNPGIHISTPQAFSEIVPKMPDINLKTVITHPVEKWKEYIQNDFETAVFNKHPLIKNLKEEIYKAGALFSLMSGSGSTVYGLFRKDKEISFNPANTFFTKTVNL